MDMGFTFDAARIALQLTSTGDDFDEAFEMLRVQVPPAGRYVNSNNSTSGDNENTQNSSAKTTGVETPSAPEIYAALLQIHEMVERNYTMEVDTVVDAMMSDTPGQFCKADIRDLSQRLLQRVIRPIREYRAELDQLEDVSSPDVPNMGPRIEYLIRDICGRVKAFHVAMNAALEGEAERGWETPAMTRARQQSEREMHVASLYREQNDALAAAARTEPSSPVVQARIERARSSVSSNAAPQRATRQSSKFRASVDLEADAAFTSRTDGQHMPRIPSNQVNARERKPRASSSAFTHDYFGIVAAKPWHESLPAFSLDRKTEHIDNESEKFRADHRAPSSKSSLSAHQVKSRDNGRQASTRSMPEKAIPDKAKHKTKGYKGDFSDVDSDRSATKLSASRSTKVDVGMRKVERGGRSRLVDSSSSDSDHDEIEDDSEDPDRIDTRSVLGTSKKSGILKSTKPAKNDLSDAVLDDFESFALGTSNNSQQSPRATRRKSVGFEDDHEANKQSGLRNTSRAQSKDQQSSSSRAPSAARKGKNKTKTMPPGGKSAKKKQTVIPGSYVDDDSSEEESTDRHDALDAVVKLKTEWKEVLQEVEDFFEEPPARKNGKRAKECNRLIRLIDDVVLMPLKAIKAEGPQKKEIRRAKVALRDLVMDTVEELDEFKPEK